MGRVGGLEGGDGLDGDRAAGDEGEELGKLRLHLRDVAAVVVEDLLGRGGAPLGIAVDRGAEAGEVCEASFIGERGHLGGDAGDLVEADGMDLFGREVCCGAAEDVVLVALCAVGQRGYGEAGAAVRGVVGRDECGEGAVGGDDVVVDGVGDLGGEVPLFVRRNAGGVFLVGTRKGSASMMPLHCPGTFSSRKRTGMRLSFMPARRTSIVWLKTRGIWRSRAM